MSEDSRENISRIEAAIKDLDLDYMRGWVSEEEYNQKMAALKAELETAGGRLPEPAPIPKISQLEVVGQELHPPTRGVWACGWTRDDWLGDHGGCP